MFIITVNDSVRLLLSALRFQQQAEKLYSESPQPHIFLHHNFFENIFPVTENFYAAPSTPTLRASLNFTQVAARFCFLSAKQNGQKNLLENKCIFMSDNESSRKSRRNFFY